MADKTKKKRFNYSGSKKIVYGLLILVLILALGGSICSGSDSPGYFNWHDLNGTDWMTPAKNQGASCYSCWAFSSAGVVEAVFNIYHNNPDIDLNLSEQQLISDNGACCGDCGNCSNIGGLPSSALEYIKDTGIVDESCFPYTGTTSSCGLCANWTDRKYHINGNFKVTPNTKEAYKEALIDYGPLSVCVQNSVINPTGGPDGKHCVVLVGWNDTGNYWIIKNSYGTGWGTDGYGTIAYGDIEKYDDARAINGIHQIQCRKNNIAWVNCSDISYNDNLTGVRINCSNISGSAAGARFRLENVHDNTTFFDNTTTTNIGGWWVYDNPDVIIRDSGDWELTAFCRDSINGGINGFPVKWQVPWGH